MGGLWWPEQNTGHRHASRHLLTRNITGPRSSASSWPAGTQSTALSLQQEGLRLQRNQRQHKDGTELSSFPGLPGSSTFIWVPCWDFRVTSPCPSLPFSALSPPFSPEWLPLLRSLFTFIPTPSFNSHGSSKHLHHGLSPHNPQRSGCLLAEKWGRDTAVGSIPLTVQVGSFLPPASNNSLYKVNSLGYAPGIERSKFIQPVRT